jgi:hypothetical protein
MLTAYFLPIPEYTWEDLFGSKSPPALCKHTPAGFLFPEPVSDHETLVGIHLYAGRRTPETVRKKSITFVWNNKKTIIFAP